MFAYSGEILTKRLRLKTFRAILRQDFAYSDQAKHNTGALCTLMSTEVSAVQGANGVRFGFLCQNVGSLSIGVIVGFIYSWELPLLTIAFFPFMILAPLA